jgi:histidinol-phosphatase (PHP family)
MWTNYHCHSKYCDGKNSIAEMIASAMEQNVFSVGISSHAPLPFPSAWCMKLDKFGDYLSEIEQQKKNTSSAIEIYKGLEVDFIPNVISPADFKSQLDYTIGSVHFVDQLDDGRRWEIDGLPTFFMEGYEQIFKSNIKDVMCRYFELTRQMISSSHPDIVGHLDKIKIQNINDQFFHESDGWYQHEIEKTLDVIQSNNCMVEVNTRGLYQKKSSTTYPSPWILERIHQRQIPITLSSDAHHIHDLVNQFKETAILLSKIGFKKMRILSGGEWQDFPFDEHGITRSRSSHHPMA